MEDENFVLIDNENDEEITQITEDLMTSEDYLVKFKIKMKLILKIK